MASIMLPSGYKPSGEFDRDKVLEYPGVEVTDKFASLNAPPEVACIFIGTSTTPAVSIPEDIP